MKNLVFILVGFILFGFTISDIPDNEIIGEEFDFQINDSTKIQIKPVLDKKTALPMYYYSDLHVNACNTGECKMIDLRMYWDIYGNYFKYQLSKALPLTKYNHKEFKPKEYIKLHILLCDTASKFRDVAFDNLTEKQAKDKVDAASGATIKLFTSDNIKGAVKTSHTLWHIANGGVKEKITQATQTFWSSDKSKALPLVRKELKTSDSINEILNSFDDLTLAQVAYIIQNIKINHINIDSIREALKAGAGAS